MIGKDPFRQFDAAQLRRLDDELDRVLDLENTGRRLRLHELSAESPELAEALGSLLATHDERLKTVGVSMDRDMPVADRLSPGTPIGSWCIDAFAASGGSADVYRGRRADGTFERGVAIKILRHDTPRLAEHFAREQRLLARLDHPRIAQILDAGRSPGVGAWFVMPWIDGDDLSAFVSKQPVGRRRLRVFLQIAETVQWAHQRLVVHRDLKPANVRIRDDDSVVLLDFGIAMLLDHEQAAHQPSRTQMAFTPSYASPEQLRGEPIGVSSDIHALGILLFELLCGRPAFGEARRSLAHAVEAICAPARPRVSFDPVVATTGGLIERDADAVVRTAFAVDPRDRYASVSELLADVRALCDRRAVSVRPRSVAVTALFALRRHPWMTAAGVLALALAGAGATVYVAQNRQIAAERAEALAEVARLEALREHVQLVLREGVAAQGMGARAALDESVAQLDKAFAGQPAMQARLLLSLGETYLAAGDHAACLSALGRFSAQPRLRAELTPGQLSELYLTQVSAQLRQGLLDDADATLRIWQDHLKGTAAPAMVAEWSIAAATLRRLRGDPAGALADQAAAVDALDGAPDARPLARGIAHANLGTTLLQAGQFGESRRQFERAIDIWGDEGLSLNWNVMAARTNLAHLLLLQGDESGALERYDWIEARLRDRGDRSAAFAALINGKARALMAQGKADAAAALSDEALAVIETLGGPAGIDRIGLLLSRVDIALMSDRSAEPWLTEVRGLVAGLPSAHPFHVRLALVDAQILLHSGRHAKALSAFEVTLPKLIGAPASMRPAVARAAVGASASAFALGEVERGRAAIDAALPVLAQIQPDTGLERLELGAWQDCLGNRKDGGLGAAFIRRVGKEYPRGRLLAECLESKVR